jgi:hypothetical protein
MVLLVLKLFVSSRPFKLEGVQCIYILLLHEGQAENHFAMFFYMVETHSWFSMFHYSWSFVCVTFHVITWLLNFIVKIMSFKPMFRILWSQHSMLYIVDQDCDGACYLKNYCFVITYLPRMSRIYAWGCLIRLKRIYNFWCSMLVYTPFALCFVTLRVIFMHFIELTY